MSETAPTSFPTMQYHPVETPVMCNTLEEVEALGPFWRGTPYAPEDLVAWRAAQAVRDKAEDTPLPKDDEDEDTPARRSRR